MWLTDTTLSQVMRSSFDKQLAAQGGPEAPLLARFDGSVSTEALAQVAINPSTPTDTLWDLHEKHTRLPRYLRIRRALAQNPSLPADILTHYAKDADTEVRWRVAQNPSSSEDALTILAKDDEIAIQRKVAAHPRTSPVDLDHLSANHPEDVCQNPSAGSTTLWRLATSGDVRLRRSVAARTDITDEILQRLRGDLDTTVLAALAGALHCEEGIEVLADLATHPSTQVRNAVAENPWTDLTVLDALAEDRGIQVRLAVAKNPSTGAHTLYHLATTQVGDHIGYHAATHPAAPLEALYPHDVATLGEEGRQRLWNLPGTEGAAVRYLHPLWEGNVETLLQEAYGLVEEGLFEDSVPEDSALRA